MGKVCRVCKVERPFTDFSKRDSSADGCRNDCKTCRNNRQTNYLSTFRGHFAQLLGHAKARSQLLTAKNRRGAFTYELSVDFLENLFKNQDARCYYSGIPMSYTCKDWHTSVERLDQTHGYTRSNVVLCCLEFNNQCQWSCEKIQQMLRLIGTTSAFSEYDFYPDGNRKKKPPRAADPIVVDGLLHYQCHFCDDRKLPEHFPKNAFSLCRACKNVASLEHRYTPRGSLKRLVSAAKQHSKKRNGTKNVRMGDVEVEFDDLVQLFREQQGLCYYSGIPLKFGNFKQVDWKCSLERKDPRIGYTKDNVCLICLEFNSIDHTVSFKHKDRGSAGWSREKFQYFLETAKLKYC